MTLDEFMDALSKTPRDWVLRGSYEAIRNADCDCPIEGVQFVTDKPRSWAEYYNIGLSGGDANAIMCAADNDDGHDPKLRARLLKACGLKE